MKRKILANFLWRRVWFIVFFLCIYGATVASNPIKIDFVFRDSVSNDLCVRFTNCSPDGKPVSFPAFPNRFPFLLILVDSSGHIVSDEWFRSHSHPTLSRLGSIVTVGNSPLEKGVGLDIRGGSRFKVQGEGSYFLLLVTHGQGSDSGYLFSGICKIALNNKRAITSISVYKGSSIPSDIFQSMFSEVNRYLSLLGSPQITFEAFSKGVQ